MSEAKAESPTKQTHSKKSMLKGLSKASKAVIASGLAAAAIGGSVWTYFKRKRGAALKKAGEEVAKKSKKGSKRSRSRSKSKSRK